MKRVTKLVQVGDKDSIPTFAGNPLVKVCQEKGRYLGLPVVRAEFMIVDENDIGTEEGIEALDAAITQEFGEDFTLESIINDSLDLKMRAKVRSSVTPQGKTTIRRDFTMYWIGSQGGEMLAKLMGVSGKQKSTHLDAVWEANKEQIEKFAGQKLE